MHSSLAFFSFINLGINGGWFVYSYHQCAESKEQQEKIFYLEEQLASVGNKLASPTEQFLSDQYADGLRKKIQSQVIWNMCLDDASQFNDLKFL